MEAPPTPRTTPSSLLPIPPAPPTAQPRSVQVRAEVLSARDGSRRTTGWIDLTAQDVED
ncbi:DUF5819 family protein, partial [Streptomyces hydrogenans]|uniref:DUF5819 family protein n=1 Tax=Streptomyces hydrogenans TaxID=1873719 RepID=UPI0033201DA6